MKSFWNVSGHEQSDIRVNDAAIKRSRAEATSETAGAFLQSGHQDQATARGDSGERSKNASDTFEEHARDGKSYEDRKLTFSEVLVKYKEMLEKLRIRLRTKDKRAQALLNKEEVERLRKQFNQVKLSRPDRQETREWSSIEQLQDRLLTLVHIEGEVRGLAKIVGQVNEILDDLLKKLNGLGSYN